MADKKAASSLAASFLAVVVAGLVAWAGSQGGVTVGPMPVFALVVCYAFIVQWLAFVPSYLLRSERFYDLVGAFTYVSAMVIAVVLSEATDSRSILLLVLVLVWAGRLGTFLFRRVRRAGKDDRFDTIKHSPSRLFMTWTLQALWVSLTLAAALAAVSSTDPQGLDAFAYAGLAVWVIGFLFETLADLQKSRFRSDPANRGSFITTGLWRLSRHPNYFGEITLWVGIALIALPVLRGWQFATLISPFFVFLLLTRVSGVPLLEKKADTTWGGQETYEAYKRRTPVLVPFLGRRQDDSPKRKRWRRVLTALAVVVLAAVLGFVVWALNPSGPMPEATAALETDEQVTVIQDDLIVFRPNAGAPRVGLIFYPGAHVDPVSYAPAMRELAAQGFLAVVTPMPLNMAVLDSDRAEEVIEDFPEVSRWAIAGHSLGGAMAAAFVASDPAAVDGLVLWAAYPSADDDLSSWPGSVASISATRDGLTTADDISRTTPLLPADTDFVVVDGGNHAQFGWYGEQRGDGVATITREEQQSQTVAATLRLLQAIQAAGG